MNAWLSGMSPAAAAFASASSAPGTSATVDVPGGETLVVVRVGGGAAARWFELPHPATRAAPNRADSKIRRLMPGSLAPRPDFLLTLCALLLGGDGRYRQPEMLNALWQVAVKPVRDTVRQRRKDDLVEAALVDCLLDHVHRVMAVRHRPARRAARRFPDERQR